MESYWYVVGGDILQEYQLRLLKEGYDESGWVGEDIGKGKKGLSSMEGFLFLIATEDVGYK